MMLKKSSLHSFISAVSPGHLLPYLFFFSLPLIGFNIPKYLLGAAILYKVGVDLSSKKNGFIHSIKSNAFGLLLVVFFPLCLILSLTHSDDIKSGIEVLLRYIYLLLVPYLLLSTEKTGLQKSIIIKSFVFGSVFLVLVNFTLLVFKWNEPLFYSYSRFFYQNLSSYVKLHPGYYSLILVISSISVLLYFKGLLKWIIFALFLLVLLLLASKGMLVIFSLCVVHYFIWHFKCLNKTRRVIIILTSLFFLINIISNSYVSQRFKDSLKSFSNTSEILNEGNNRLDENLVRLFLFQYSWETIIQNKKTFFLGHGIGDFRTALLDTYKRNEYGYGLHYQYNSHNQYLSTMLMVGALGLVLYLLYLLAPLLAGKITSDYKYFIFVVLLYGLVESCFYREAGIILISSFISVYTLCQNNYRNIAR